MREPIKIGSFYNPEGVSIFSEDAFLLVLNRFVEKTLNRIDKPGILLSGGVDSAILAILAAKYYPDIPCFVVGQSESNPDVKAAKQLARDKGLNLKVRIVNSREINDIQQELKENINANTYPGDECVFTALKFAAENNVTGIIATDGIDELMGGYWGHRDRKQFPDVKDAFEYFWDELEEKHLIPMYRSAKFFELDLIFIYLLPEIVEFLSMIPLDNRIGIDIGKIVWRKIAKIVGVPLWIIERQKRGFLDAFIN